MTMDDRRSTGDTSEDYEGGCIAVCRSDADDQRALDVSGAIRHTRTEVAVCGALDGLSPAGRA